MHKVDLIKTLQLEEHPTEGGYFRRTYESDTSLYSGPESRPLMTSIYYLLTDDSPCGYMHRNKSDILHFHHAGQSIRYWIISPDGQLTEKWLGQNILKGECPQMLVKGGDWKISQLVSGDYGLISEAVTPGFDFRDNEIAGQEHVRR